jgi:hypothetical protein
MVTVRKSRNYSNNLLLGKEACFVKLPGDQEEMVVIFFMNKKVNYGEFFYSHCRRRLQYGPNFFV